MNSIELNVAALPDETNSISPQQCASTEKFAAVWSGFRICEAFSAIFDDDLAKLASIVRTKRQANWQSTARMGWSLLDAAVSNRSSPSVAFLLSKGADPNTLFRGRFRDRLATEEGMYSSPLLTAILFNEVEIVGLLLDAGGSLDLPEQIDFHTGNLDCRHWLDIYKLGPAVAAFREAKALARSIGTPIASDGRLVDKRPRL
jgi:hypothetical protein